MSSIEFRTLFLLLTVFPSLLDLYYKDSGDLRFQINIIVRAGYYKYLDEINEVYFKKISLEFINSIREWNLSDIEVLLVFDNYCEQYLEYVKKERKLLWMQFKNMLASNKKFSDFVNACAGSISENQLSSLDRAEEFFNYTELYLKKLKGDVWI